MSKKFSIAMCTYNGERHLPEQFASFAAQTRLPDELVVCDDGSTDATPQITRNFAGSAPFSVSLYTNEQNLGPTKNFERAIGLCTGDFIALSDHDDVWQSQKLAELEAEFDRAPHIGLIFTDAEIIDESSRPTGQTLWGKLPLRQAERERLRSDRAVGELLQGSMVTGATMAFRARFKELVLPIPDYLPIIHDGWIALLVAAVSEVLPLPAALIKYRQHRGQQVGARERRGPGPPQESVAESMHNALQRENPYSEVLAVAGAVRTRLLEKRAAFESGNVLARLEDRIAHLETRSSLPPSRLGRAPRVFRELITGRYHHYAKGVQSAIKDLLA